MLVQKNRRGAGLVEYGLLLMLISVVLIIPLTFWGGLASTMFGGVPAALGSGPSSSPGPDETPPSDGGPDEPGPNPSDPPPFIDQSIVTAEFI